MITFPPHRFKIPFFLAVPSIPHAALVQYAFATSTSPSDLPGLPQILAPLTDQSCAHLVSQHTHRRRLPSRTSVVRKPP